jgi:predicted signal transduction protein with EAL and GGDEF domain
MILAAAGLVLARKRKNAMLALLTALTTVIPSQHRSFRQLKRELERARRYQRPLSLVVVNLEDLGPQQAASSAGSNEGSASRQTEQNVLIVSAIVGRLVRDTLREGDLLAYNAAHNRYIVALPETNKAHALLLAARLQALVWERAGLRPTVAVTEFPTDGLTTEELLNRAYALRTPIGLQRNETPTGERPLATREAA